MNENETRKNMNAYIEKFNHDYPHSYSHTIDDSQAFQWLWDNVPLFTCSDKILEEIYYFRWWTFRKHIKKTKNGFVITEFLENVWQSEKEGTINCPIGHHFYEGRWLKNHQYLYDYARFMLKEGNLHRYTCWFVDGLYNFLTVTGEFDPIKPLFPLLEKYYGEWKKTKKNKLFYSPPYKDGMEYSISGNHDPRCRPTLNSYMYGDALAISKLAHRLGYEEPRTRYLNEARVIRKEILSTLWDKSLFFFISMDEEGNPVPKERTVREIIGYIPWYFNIPTQEHETAWNSIKEKKGFYTSIGLTTAEQQHPQFQKINPERLCSWDGAIWPFTTSQTLSAMQNFLRNYKQNIISKKDYIRELRKYAASHCRQGKPSIGEVIRDPHKAEMNGSEHYNHSTYCDLIINGLVGIIPKEDNMIVIDPLCDDTIDYFDLDKVSYRGNNLRIIWDKSGCHQDKPGFYIYLNGKKEHYSCSLKSYNILF